MPDRNVPEQSQQRRMALSRWETDGGAGLGRPEDDAFLKTEPAVPDLINAELTQLRVRIIALENLMIALLSGASNRQLDLAREMAGYILPRPGFTQHPLTVLAASNMTDLIQRSGQFRVPPLAPIPFNRTAVFDENTLPAGLRKEHRTKQGVWGVIRVLDGRVRYTLTEPEGEFILEPGHPGLVLPDHPHRIEPLGPMRMLVEFYDCHPDL